MNQTKKILESDGITWWIDNHGQIKGLNTKDEVMHIFWCANPPEEGTEKWHLFRRVCDFAVNLGILRPSIQYWLCKSAFAEV